MKEKMTMSRIKRGDLVEFTDAYYQHYPPSDASLIRYGVAIEDERAAGAPVTVKIADGSEVLASHIYSYAWAGWVPEGLEEILREVCPEDMHEYDMEDM